MLTQSRPAIYQGAGDQLMQEDVADRIILVPDAYPSKTPDACQHIRIMWGQHLLDDLMAGRYRSLICAVNSHDNSHGIISQVAAFSRTSQWDAEAITAYARYVGQRGSKVRVLKYDMDTLEVLAVLRPESQEALTLTDLSASMKMVSEMLRQQPRRLPAASVSFLEARANRLVDDHGSEPSFESVLSVIYDAGYRGDIYPSPSLWRAAPTAVYARYPFSSSLDARRNGGC
ncbi:MAG: hypothetical protein ACTHN5_21475 [Phycisphaerae bacterium]